MEFAGIRHQINLKKHMGTPLRCFVIMPFSDTEHGPTSDRKKITEAQWAHIFQNWIKKAVESFAHPFICSRSPAKSGNFVKGIVMDLNTADLVIADLTGAKPNVYYELGIRHALRTGTIIITQHLDAMPSDLKSYYAFEYNYSPLTHEYDLSFANFEKSLHEKMRAWLDAKGQSDSPVSDFLGFTSQYAASNKAQEESRLKGLLSDFLDSLNHNFMACEYLLKQLKGVPEPIKTGTVLIVDVLPIDTIYARLTSYDWKYLERNILKNLEFLIVNVRRMFHAIQASYQQLQGNPNNAHLRQNQIASVQGLLDGRKTIVDELNEIIRLSKVT